MNKIPLLDPLGLPISPEIVWDSIGETVRSVAQVVKGGAVEFNAATAETAKAVSGRGLDMHTSLTGFQEGKARSEELVQEEETVRELRRQRMFFSTLNEKLGEAHQAPTPEVDEFTVEAATMSTEERNKIYGVNVDLKREHTSNAHAIAWVRRELMEARGKEKQAEEAPIPSPAKQEPNALDSQFEGGAGAIGGGKANLRAQLG